MRVHGPLAAGLLAAVCAALGACAGCSASRGTAVATSAATPAGAPTPAAAPTGPAGASGPTGAVGAIGAASPPAGAPGATPSPSGSGSPAASGSPATPGPRATPSPSSRPVAAPAPRAVPGYTLSAPPRTLGNPLDAVRGARDLFAAGAARSVGRGDTPVGVLLLLALRPEYAGDAGVEPSLVRRVAAGIGSGGPTPSLRTWNRRPVAVASTAEGGTIVVWSARGVLGVVVGGGDPDLVTGYARAYVAAL